MFKALLEQTRNTCPTWDRGDPHSWGGDTAQLRAQETELIKEMVAGETVTENSRDEKFNDIEWQQQEN